MCRGRLCRPLLIAHLFATLPGCFLVPGYRHYEPVVISSNPPGGEILIDGRSAGTTPCVVNVLDGPLPPCQTTTTIEVRKAGYTTAYYLLHWRGLSFWPDNYEDEVTIVLQKNDDQQPAATTEPASGTQPRERSIHSVHVLAIGIGAYRDGRIPSLRNACNDARSVFQFFRSSPLSPARAENVSVLASDEPHEAGITTDKSGILKAIEENLIQKATDPSDMAIIYFSGHGICGKHPTKSAGQYLIPSDADQEHLFSTAIEMDDLQKYFDAIHATMKVLIVDACNAGGFNELRNIAISPAPGQEGAMVVLASSNVDEMSLESSVFTKALIEGLEGKADELSGDRDGRVSFRELQLWIEKVVPQRTSSAGGKQTPRVTVPPGLANTCLTR